MRLDVGLEIDLGNILVILEIEGLRDQMVGHYTENVNNVGLLHCSKKTK